MALPPDRVMPLVKEGFAPPETGDRYFLKLGDMVYGQVKAPQLPPSHHRIKHRLVLVGEVGSDEHYYVYLEVPTWLVNGTEIGNYHSCVYLETWRSPTKDNQDGRANLANQQDLMKHINRIMHIRFWEWKLGTPDLNKKLDELYQNRLAGETLESQLVPPPVQLSRSNESWQQKVNHTQLKAGQIDCTVEIVVRRSKSIADARAKLDNQCAFDMHSTFEDVLSWFLENRLFTIKDTVDFKSVLGEEDYAFELWVLPQKHDEEMYEWKKDSAQELGVFLDKDVWKEHKQLYIEAHFTDGPKEVADGEVEGDE